MQPGNSGIAISVVDRRLMAMLEELESGLRRAEAAERILGASFGAATRRTRKRQAEAEAGSAFLKASNAIQSLDRPMAVILFLWVASIIWCFLLSQGVGSPPVAAVAEGLESWRSPTLARGTSEMGLHQRRSASNDAEGPRAERHADGLSAEEFEREVQRVLSENRNRTQTGGNSAARVAKNPAAAEDAFALLGDRSFPEPLPPPVVAKGSPAETVAAEADAGAVEASPPIIVKAAKAKAPSEKVRKQRIASKQPTPSAPGRADHEPPAPRSFVAMATDTINGVIKSWSRWWTGADARRT